MNKEFGDRRDVPADVGVSHSEIRNRKSEMTFEAVARPFRLGLAEGGGFSWSPTNSPVGWFFLIKNHKSKIKNKIGCPTLPPGFGGGWGFLVVPNKFFGGWFFSIKNHKSKIKN
jgi:hypothetical protein